MDQETKMGTRAGDLAPTAPNRTASAQDRRRPGRLEHVSPELIQLLRQPSHASRARMEDEVPAFMRQPSRRARRRQNEGFGFRIAVAIIYTGIISALTFEAMYWSWG